MLKLIDLEGRFSLVERNHREMTSPTEDPRETPGYIEFRNIEDRMEILRDKLDGGKGRAPLLGRAMVYWLILRYMMRYNLSGRSVTIMDLRDGRVSFRTTRTL